MSDDSTITYNFCQVAELKTKKSITRWVDELRDEITAVYLSDKIQVVSSVCPHFGGDFIVDVDKGEMLCRWHAWRFCISDGHCTNRNLKTALRQYEHFEQDGVLMIRAS